MKTKIKYIFLALLLCIIIILTFFKSPADISKMLTKVASDLTALAVINHCIYITVVLFGFRFKKWRNVLFPILLLYLSGSASIVSIKYLILPNIIIFVTFFVLIFIAFQKKQFNFNLPGQKF